MKDKITLVFRFGIVVLFLTSIGLVTSARAAQKSAAASPVPAAKSQTPAKKGNLSAKDKTFMTNAAKGGAMEVEWGKLAAQNGQNADVKKFGNRMVTDHSKANNELTTLAKEEGVALPGVKSPGKWKSDKDYMGMMIKDHEADLTEFQEEAQTGTDPDVKAFAAKGAKMVSKHLALARQTQSKLK